MPALDPEQCREPDWWDEPALPVTQMPSLGVMFPPEVDEPAPPLGPMPPGPWRDPEPIDPSQMCHPPLDPSDPPPPALPAPTSHLPTVDFSHVDDVAPPLGPAPTPSWTDLFPP